MKNVLFAAKAVLLIVSLTAFSARAQIPHVQLFFGENASEYAVDCPVGMVGVPADVAILAINFNMPIAAIEFAVDYSPALTWLADLSSADVMIGSSPVEFGGIALDWKGQHSGPAVFQPREVSIKLQLYEQSSQVLKTRQIGPLGTVVFEGVL